MNNLTLASERHHHTYLNLLLSWQTVTQSMALKQKTSPPQLTARNKQIDPHNLFRELRSYTSLLELNTGQK